MHSGHSTLAVGCLTFLVAIGGASLIALADERPQAIALQNAEGQAAPHIENTFRVSEKIFSGGGPVTAADFEALRQVGVKTIISVDGQPPNSELARKYGLKYIHLPMGYGAVAQEQAAKIVQAVGTAKEPVFIHCHHGKHRGPAAVAIAARALEGWSSEEAQAWLKQAGTSADYRQLIQSVCETQPLSSQQIAKLNFVLPESVPPPPLTERMLAIDDHFQNLKSPPAKILAASPASQREFLENEVQQLLEQLKEVQRQENGPNPKAQAAFNTLLRGSVEPVSNLQEVLKDRKTAGESPLLNKVYVEFIKQVGQSCVRCHQQFRDNPAVP